MRKKALRISFLTNWSPTLVALEVCTAHRRLQPSTRVSTIWFHLVPCSRLTSPIVPAFKRAQVAPISPSPQIPRQILRMDGANSPPAKCAACENHHLKGHCPLKKAGVEICPLCGIAHFGRARICPHINSVTQLQAMQEALKHSPEPLELRDLARKKVTGLIGSIRQKRKLEAEAKAAKESQALRQSSHPGSNFTPVQHASMNRQNVSRHTDVGVLGKENRMAGLYVPAPPYRQ